MGSMEPIDLTLTELLLYYAKTSFLITNFIDYDEYTLEEAFFNQLEEERLEKKREKRRKKKRKN